MTRRRGKPLTVAGLEACIAGLIVSPCFYIATGALAQFPPRFGLVTLPPLLLASGFLLWRLLAGPTRGAPSPAPTAHGLALLALEALSFVAIAMFLVLISGVSLMTRFERLGLFCSVHLLMSAACLPLLLRRDTPLARRLGRPPRGLATAVLLLTLVASGAIAAVYQLQEPVFIGQAKECGRRGWLHFC